MLDKIGPDFNKNQNDADEDIETMLYDYVEILLDTGKLAVLPIPRVRAKPPMP